MDSDAASEQVKDVYAHFGLAIYHAQCLEHGLVNALVFLDHIPNKHKAARSAAEWAESVDCFMDSKFEFTLGRMIRELERVVSVEPDLQGLLASALTKRNWLAHGYFKDRAETFLTRSGRTQMLSELQEAQELFCRADEALDQAIRPARLRVGLTDEALAAEYEKLRAEVGS
jgi:hypothetical protein